ncbi:MAG: hypothetical protein WCT12_03235 [Verrucomicrobiota bacterium]
MRLDRLTYEPGSLAAFYEEGFTALGALCERTWHDRLEIVAEGEAAKLWNPDGALHATELAFAPGDATSARDAAREVFPGCPLTFRLAETLRPSPLPLERVVLAGEARVRPPDQAVAEKLWRAQFSDTTRWRLMAEFKAGYHFSLITLVRCEIQAIDQHWSLHRLAAALPGGEPDEALARELGFAQADAGTAAGLVWPTAEPAEWQALLQAAIEADLAGQLAAIRTRQESYLRRELDRIDSYFEHYEQELSARATRSSSESAKLKTADRLTAAKAEHTRRRADQVARHEIRVQPHLDALLLVAEPAWRASLQVELAHQVQTLEARFVPRARRWFRS